MSTVRSKSIPIGFPFLCTSLLQNLPVDNFVNKVRWKQCFLGANPYYYSILQYYKENVDNFVDLSLRSSAFALS